MKEILQLQYNAGAAAFDVTVPFMKNGARQIGSNIVEPRAHVTVESLSPEAQAAWSVLAAELMTRTDAAHAALATDPVELARKAAELAAKEQAIAAERAAANEAVAAARAELEALTVQKAAVESDLAAKGVAVES